MWDNPEEKEVGKCIHEKRLLLVDPDPGPGEDVFWNLVHEVAHAALPDNDEHSVQWVEHAVQKITDRYPSLKI